MTIGFDFVKLVEVIRPEKGSIAMGPFGSNITADNFVDSGIPVIQGRQLNSLFLEEVDYRFLTLQKAETLKNSKARKRDIVITHRGTLGQVGIIPDDSEYDEYIVSQSQLKFTVDGNICDPFFVYYFLRSHIGQYELLKNTTSVGVPAIAMPTASVKKINIPFPKLPIQQKISTNLRMIDLSILENKKIGKTSQEIISALFRSWFIDFDPVKAKAEGKLPYGMDVETAALFPDTFEDSELGPIPTDWRIQYLVDLCDIQRGFSYTGASLCEQSEGIAMINLASFVEGGGYKHTGLKHVSSEFKEKFYIKQGDVFIATVDLTPGLRVVGSPLIAPQSLENKSIFSQDLLRLRNKTGEKIGRGFLFHWLKIRRGILKQWSSGTTVSRFPISALNRYPVLIPPREILQHFENIFEHTQEFSDLSETKMTHLSLTRDSLLPKLMSGELSIS